MNENEIKTHDLYFSAYLKAKGCQIIEIERDGTKTIFTFAIPEPNKASELKNGYFDTGDDRFTARACAFADAIRSLKTLCHVKDEGGDTIITPDLYFAAYLKTKNCDVKTASKNSYKTVFVFNVKNSGMSILELKLGYFNNIDDAMCTVNASSYTDAVRSLKTMCHITSN